MRFDERSARRILSELASDEEILTKISPIRNPRPLRLIPYIKIRVRKRTKAREVEAEDEEERGRKGRERDRDESIVECRSLFTYLLDGVFFAIASPWILQPQTLFWSASVWESASFSCCLRLTFSRSSCFQGFWENVPTQRAGADVDSQARVKVFRIAVRELVRLLVSLARRPLHNRPQAHSSHV